MRANIPKGMGGGPQNMQALLRQTQKMQEDMAAKQEELDAREYDISAGGGVVPMIPISIGKINNQSRKIFNTVLIIVATITSIGETSFLQKHWKFTDNADGIANNAHQNTYSFTIGI